MSRCRVVDPKSDRLSLSDGDWIDVKRDLNAGEYVDMLRDMADRKAFAPLLAYILGWSFTGLDGQPLAYDLDSPEDVRRATIRSLDKATSRELTAVIRKHEAAQEAALEAKKKTPDDTPASSPTSGSPSAVTGASSGSES